MESIDGSREVEGSIRMNHYNGQYISLKIFLKLKFNSFSFLFFVFLQANLQYLGAVWMAFFHHSIFVTQFPLLIAHHSSLITLKYHTCLAPSLTCHHSIFFILFVGPIPITRYNFFFFSSTQKPELERKKKKRNPDHLNPVKEEKKKKKKNLETQTQ